MPSGERTVRIRCLMMDSNGQFSDIGCLPAKSLPQLRRNAALAMAALAKGGCVRISAVSAWRTQCLLPQLVVANKITSE
jgi:hypothetical protein